MKAKDMGFDTKLIHSGDIHERFGSAVTPIYQTSTFSFRNAQHGADLFAGREKGYIYTRMGNPTINALENKLADLENGCGGIALASGMAAVTTVYMTLLSHGDHVISTDAVYGPTRKVMEVYFSKFGVEYSYINTSNFHEIEIAIKPNTKLLFLETPAIPTIKLTDIRKASEIAHKYDILVCVDNTFCSPYLQKPLDLGADIVVHSLTKFMNGHADIVGGIIIAKDEKLYDKLRRTMIHMGGNMDPHQAYIVIRGVKTLSIRIDKAQSNAQKIAEFLEYHPKVAWIKYSGLKSFDQIELAREQMRGSGSMMSFGLRGGFLAGKTLMDNVHLATLAVSLGGVEDLIADLEDTLDKISI